MQQIWVNIYAIANIILLLWYIYKYGWQFSPGLLVLSFYVLVAVLAIPAYEILQHDSFFHRYDFTNVTFFPYVFLFITTLLFLKPTFKFKGYIKNVQISISERKLRYFIIIYTLFSLVSVYCFYRTITSNITVETLAQIRQDHYAGNTLKAYNNVIEHFIILFTVRFNTVATIVFFYVLAVRQIKLNKWWLIGMGIGVVAPNFMDAIMTASRGMIISQAFLCVLCYSYFSNLYSKRFKRALAFLGCFILVVFFIYSMVVTMMRFGSDDDSFSSLISYFGQPTIIFNSQVAESMDFANGVRFFHPVAEFLGMEPDKIIMSITKPWSPCFDTFIGDLYVDFGPIGTFLISLFVPYFVNSLFSKKKSLTLSHLYLMTFYCLTLQHGALVTGRGLCTDILFCIIVYNLTKLMLGRSRKNHKIVSV